MRVSSMDFKGPSFWFAKLGRQINQIRRPVHSSEEQLGISFARGAEHAASQVGRLGGVDLTPCVSLLVMVVFRRFLCEPFAS